MCFTRLGTRTIVSLLVIGAVSTVHATAAIWAGAANAPASPAILGDGDLTPSDDMSSSAVADVGPASPVLSSGGSLSAEAVTVLGQFAIGFAGGSGNDLAQGAVPCWTAIAIPGDVNGDGVVDLADFAEFGSCAAGNRLDPVPSYTDPACAALDFDSDGDVDLEDFADFQIAFLPEG